MSGGSMDYVYGRIYEAAQQVKDYRRDVAQRPIEDFEFDAKRTAMTPKHLKIKVLRYLDNGWVKLREAEPLRVGGQRLVLGPYGFEQPRGVGILHGQAAERKAQIRTHAAPGVPALVDGAGPVEAGAHRLRPPVGQRAQACFFRLLHEGGQQLGAAGGIGAAGERVEQDEEAPCALEAVHAGQRFVQADLGLGLLGGLRSFGFGWGWQNGHGRLRQKECCVAESWREEACARRIVNHSLNRPRFQDACSPGKRPC